MKRIKIRRYLEEHSLGQHKENAIKDLMKHFRIKEEEAEKEYQEWRKEYVTSLRRIKKRC